MVHSGPSKSTPCVKVLRTLPEDRLLTLRYEDFFTDPKRQLDTQAAFLGRQLVDEDWSIQCAATVRQPRSTWRDLPDETARELTEACRPGFELPGTSIAPEIGGSARCLALTKLRWCAAAVGFGALPG
jgi:hypothetical protein